MTDVVCFSTADWDAPLWTNKQHLMSRLADRGVHVLYIDSLGLRAPGLGTDDLRRIGRRLKAWRPYAKTVAPRVRRDSPLLVPFHRHRSIRSLNERLITARVVRNVQHWRMARPVAWTYNPMSVDYLTACDFSAVVYHCVDDLAAYPGIDGPGLRAAERRLAQRADVCIASARPLVEHLESLGAKRVLYWPNPADVEAFRSLPRRIRPAGEPPVIGFIGAVQDHKIDVGLLARCAQAHPEWRFEIVGPIGHGLTDSGFDLDALPANVSCPGAVPKEDLPEVLSRFDVGLIPYARNDYTACVFPMKVFEYMAAGLPVVSTSLPSLVGEIDHIHFADGVDAFSEAIRTALDSDTTTKQDARRRYAEGFSWNKRADEALLLLKELDARETGPSLPGSTAVPAPAGVQT